MTPVHGCVEVAIPLEKLWAFFVHANRWPRWNKAFFWVHNRDLVPGKQLIWCFRPIRRLYPYLMPAFARIVEVEPNRKVTWEVSAFPGFYARHSYYVEDLGDGRTRFGSWEKASGWAFRLMKRFWIAHFRFVRDRSLEGVLALDKHYRTAGRLDAKEFDESAHKRDFRPSQE